ncbi:MAG: hypothetical protein KAT62_02540 [Desulfuromonadales bacterium]|nr:hypothetical protein [Desulfuromonadales bacterium]
MARSRNIKPGLFHNDVLAELDPIDRLFFIGLWTICDYKGCLEYRPKKIKVQILPYDDVPVEEIATNLDKSGFISIYSVQGKKYLKVLNFTKHQNPHKNEKAAGSEIPDISHNDSQPIDSKGIDTCTDKITTNRDENGTSPADSLLLIPDSLNPNKTLLPGAEEAHPSETTVLTIPTISFNTQGEVFSITSPMITEWQDTYPLMDVDQELKRAIQWARDNPGKRKTLKGMKRYLGSWLSRRHDKGYANENARGNFGTGKNQGRLSAGDRVRAKAEQRASERAREVGPGMGGPG